MHNDRGANISRSTDFCDRRQATMPRFFGKRFKTIWKVALVQQQIDFANF